MRLPARLAAALAFAALLGGCDLLSRLNNNTIMTAVLLQSPSPPASFPGSAPVTVAQVFLGQKQGDLTTPPSQQSITPIVGANVVVTWEGNAAGIALKELGSGNYALDSTSSGLQYAAGDTYRFTATVGSTSYWAEVQQVPQPTQITEFSTPNPQVMGPMTYGAIQDPFTVSRTGSDIAFYAVFPVPGGGSFDPSATPSCTNLPQDAGGILQLVFQDSAWRVPQFPLPKATCFPAPAAYSAGYVVALTDVKKGDTSGNLSAFSAALAGTSAAGGVVVSGP